MEISSLKKISVFILILNFIFVPILNAQQKKEEIKEGSKDINEVIDTSIFEKTGGDIWLNKRVSISPMFGAVLNDAYSNILQFGLSANYNLTQRSGVEMSLFLMSASDGDVVTYFQNRFLSTPDRNLPKFYLGFNYTYTALTSSLNYRDSRKIPYLIKVAPGLGLTFLSSMAYPIPPNYTPVPTNNQVGFTLSADVIQEFFLSDRLAVRMDIRNHMIMEQVYKADVGTALRSRFNINTAIVVGATWYCLPTSTKFKFSECL